MKIDNGTGGSRETSTGKPARVDEWGRESINFFAELKRRAHLPIQRFNESTRPSSAQPYCLS